MADMLLGGKKVILGVTGGIAVYKAADLCSKLVQAGADVDVILTEAAAKFVAPLTFAALAGRAARVDMWSTPGGEPIPHVAMAAAADLVIVAPLSANTLAKLALGLADNLLTATFYLRRRYALARARRACPGCWRPRWSRTCGQTLPRRPTCTRS